MPKKFMTKGGRKASRRSGYARGAKPRVKRRYAGGKRPSMRMRRGRR